MRQWKWFYFIWTVNQEIIIYFDAFTFAFVPYEHKIFLIVQSVVEYDEKQLIWCFIWSVNLISGKLSQKLFIHVCDLFMNSDAETLVQNYNYLEYQNYTLINKNACGKDTLLSSGCMICFQLKRGDVWIGCSPCIVSFPKLNRNN